MNSRALVIALPSLLCGALLGYFIRPAAPAADAPEAREARPSPRVALAATDDAALNRLRKRIQDLERRLAEKSAESPSGDASPEPTETPPTAASPERRGPPSPEEMRARLEEMRTTDPERYAQMTNRFANMRAHQLQRAQNKLDILATVDVNRLTPRQRQIHEQYQDLIARQEELRNLAFAAPDDAAVTDEQRRAAHEEMREIGRQLHGVAQQERELLLSQTVRSFGVRGDTARELVETVKAVYQATESRGGHGGHRPPR